ncbi:MAG: hypothetical protein K5776_01560 [Lachnospiraceae bacterium]|nr:hypothetical protein [Lachnospiraceae bacterium]
MSKAETKPKKNKRNAVLYKEMTVDMKKPKIMIIMLLINLFILPITLGFFLGIAIAVFNNACSYRVLAWYLIAMVYTEFFILLLITPAITAGSVSLEKERQTLDVLLTTRMTTWEIIKGKYSSSVLFLSLMVLSTFPLLALVFIYGGISLLQLFYVGVMMFVLIAFVSSFGVFFSSLTKNTIVSVILTYIVLMLYISVTIAMPFTLLGIVKSLNDYLYYDTTYFSNIITKDFINGDFLVMTGTFNPLLMLFDCIGHTIGYDFSDLGSVKGMITICGTDIMPHFTDKNIMVNLWTPISMIEMLLFTFINLRISAFFLNPVKGRNKSEKKAVAAKKPANTASSASAEPVVAESTPAASVNDVPINTVNAAAESANAASTVTETVPSTPAEPVAAESTPAVNESTPVVNESTPIVNESAPITPVAAENVNATPVANENAGTEN